MVRSRYPRVFGSASAMATSRAAFVATGGVIPMPSPSPTPTPTPGLADIRLTGIGTAGIGHASGLAIQGGIDFGLYSNVDDLLVTPGNARGFLLPTRGAYMRTASQGNTVRGGEGLGMSDAYPGDIGYKNSNRGNRVPSFDDLIQLVGGRLRINLRPRKTGEAAHLHNATIPSVGSMIATNLSMCAKPPMAVHMYYQGTIDVDSHATPLWMVNIADGAGIELDIESKRDQAGNGDGSTFGGNGNYWPEGESGPGNGQVYDSAKEYVMAIHCDASGIVRFYQAIVPTSTDPTTRAAEEAAFATAMDPANAYRSITGYGARVIARAFHLFSTNHVYANDGGNIGADSFYFIRKILFYAQARIVPLIEGATYRAAFGQNISVQLPSTEATWGAAANGRTEYIYAWQVETNEPGSGENGRGYAQIPTGLAIDGNKLITGAITDRAGRFHVARWLEGPGAYCQKQHIVFEIGPKILINSLSFTNGQVVDFDLFAAVDFGVLCTNGVTKDWKITLGDLTGTGLTLSSDTGRLTGTVANNLNRTVTMEATNSVQQKDMKQLPMTSSAATAAPWLSDANTIADFDANDGVVYDSNGYATAFNNAVIGAQIVASIAGTTLTVTAVNSGVVAVGLQLDAAAMTAGTRITAPIAVNADGTGTYTVNNSQTRDSQSITGRYNMVAGGVLSHMTQADGLNGRKTLRVVRDVTTVNTISRFTSYGGASSLLSTMFAGSKKPYSVLFAFKPTDASTGAVFSAGRSVSSSDAKQIEYTRRSATASTIARGSNSTNQNSVPLVAQPSGNYQLGGISSDGTTITAWLNGVKVADKVAQDYTDVLDLPEFALFFKNTVPSQAVAFSQNFDRIVTNKSAKSDADMVAWMTYLAGTLGRSLT